jgi:flavin reductase (DIM6/NTAB) family NADH-FMN oxidoreductase RutF
VSEAFREAMAAVPAGVVVVSAREKSGWRGLTATSFTSVSVEPPLVLVCLERDARTREAVKSGRAFNVSVLERGQEFIAERFAGRGPLVRGDWEGVPHDVGGNGLPLVRGCVAWFECELHDALAVEDHEIVLGAVGAAGRRGGEPLVLWDRTFWRLG